VLEVHRRNWRVVGRPLMGGDNDSRLSETKKGNVFRLSKRGTRTGGKTTLGRSKRRKDLVANVRRKLIARGLRQGRISR